MLVPNIDLVFPEAGVNAVAAAFFRSGLSPFQASLYVASRPFVFDGIPSTGQYSVRNLVSGEITHDYRGATTETVIQEGEFIFKMDNGDVLNISSTQRKLAAAVFARMTQIISAESRLN